MDDWMTSNAKWQISYDLRRLKHDSENFDKEDLYEILRNFAILLGVTDV